MTRISVHQARAGMEVGHPIKDPAGRTLLERGVVLTDDLIARLKKFGVSHLEVEGAVAAGDLTAGTVRDMLEELSQEYPVRTPFGCALELRMHGPPAVEELCGLAERADPIHRPAALRLLGHVAHLFSDAALADFLPVLDAEAARWDEGDNAAAPVANLAGIELPGLDAQDPAVREQAVRAAIPVLARCMADGDERVRRAAAEGLERITPPPQADLAAARREALERGLDDSHPEVMLSAALGLEHDAGFLTDQGRARIGRAYLHVLAGTSVSIRRYRAVLGLGRVDVAGGRETLLGLLDDPTLAVRRSALYALGDLRERGALPRMMAMASDPDDGSRAWACRGLGMLGDAAAVPTLVQALHDPQEHVFRQAVESLVALGERSESALVGALGDGNWFVRYDACRILAEVGGLRALPALKIRAGADAHRFVREAAVAAAEAILHRQGGRG